MATYKVRVKGTAHYLQHRYPMPDEEAKFAEECKGKGLDPKKTSNIEASWYRDDKGSAYIPSEHLKGALVGAGKGEKVGGKGNATWNNILKVAVAVLPAEVPFVGKQKYDDVHKAYVKVGMARVLRERPFFAKGWEAEFTVEADSADIDETHVKKFVTKAGKRGIGDYRPEKGGSYGTFEVVKFERLES